LILCVVAGLALLVPGLVVPAAVRIFVDQYLGQGNTSWLWKLVVVVAVAAAVTAAFTLLQQVVLLRLSSKLSISMSTRFFEHILRLPIGFFTQRCGGHVVNRLQYNDQIATLLSSQLSTAVLASFTAVMYAALMFVYDWQLALLTIALAGPGWCRGATSLAIRAERVSRRPRRGFLCGTRSRSCSGSAGALSPATNAGEGTLEVLAGRRSVSPE
jgi:ABC-type bacteriocin/lantibiotic exporter with double-glycine peptidase domain